MRISFSLLILWGTIMLSPGSSQADLGHFERSADIGRVSLPGSARFDPATGRY